MSDATFIQACPSPESYIALRAACRMPEIDHATAIMALAGSVRCLSLYKGERLIGFGRIVGDYALNYYIQDVIITPSEKRQGYHGLITQALRSWLEQTARPDAKIHVMPSPQPAQKPAQKPRASRAA